MILNKNELLEQANDELHSLHMLLHQYLKSPFFDNLFPENSLAGSNELCIELLTLKDSAQTIIKKLERILENASITEDIQNTVR